MTARRAGVVLALVHVLLVGTLGLKLLADRARLPRAWARTVPYDPNLPIRGRYVRLRLEVHSIRPTARVPGSTGGYGSERTETACEARWTIGGRSG